MTLPNSSGKGSKPSRAPFKGTQSQPPSSPDPFTATDDPAWLSSLACHSIFHDEIAGQSPSASQQRSPQMVMCTRGAHLIFAPPMSDQRTATLRITSLIDSKHQADARGSAAFGSYKVLTSAVMNFPIRTLRPSPNGKLLAVVGDKQVAVVVLPRVGRISSSLVGALEHLPVNAIRIGSYYHSSRSNDDESIVKVEWHPWGEGGNSLLVLSRDGYLREYDVSRDASEPQQSLGVFPGVSSSYKSRARPPPRARSRSRSRTPGPGDHTLNVAGFNTRGWSTRLTPETDNNLGRIAASFTLGLDASSFTEANTHDRAAVDPDESVAYAGSEATAQQADWSPLTLYVIARNGDVHSYCPFLPAHAAIPASYLRSLASYLSRLNSLEVDLDTSSRQKDLAQRFIGLLLRQARDDASLAAKGSVRGSTGLNDDGIDDRQWSRMRTTPPASTPVRPSVLRASAMSIDPVSPSPQSRMQCIEYGGAEEDDDLLGNNDIVLTSPSVLSPALFADVVPQGPYLITPLPLDLIEEREASATDILFTRVCAPVSSGSEASAPVHILAIANDDGRLDLTLVLQPIEPHWRESGTGHTRQKKSSGRYAMSDSDSELDDTILDLTGTQSLPSLYVYETVNLGLLRTLHVQNSATVDDRVTEILARNVTTLVADPLYADTFYAYHSLGAHAVSVRQWSRALSRAMSIGDGDESDVDASHSGELPRSRSEAITHALHQMIPSDVVWVVRTRLPNEGIDLESSGALSGITPVSAFCVLSDVYLSYALLVLTADFQLVGIELNLREIEADFREERDESTELSPPKDALGGYTSLLGPTSFVPPKLFSTTSLSLSSMGPRLAASAAAGSADVKLPPGARAAELTVTPSTLRFLANRATTMRAHLRDIVKAGNAVQARLDVLLREMERVLGKLADVKARCAEDGGDAAGQAASNEGLSTRLKRVTLHQRELIGRTDRILQRLVEAHSPALTQYEKAWREELGRMVSDIGLDIDEEGRRRVNEEDEEGGRGLSLKVAKLQHQLDLLRPGLQKLRFKGRELPTDGPAVARAGQLGHSQRVKIEQALGTESALLIEARSRIQGLNARLGGVLQDERTSVAPGGLRIRLGTEGRTNM